MVHMGDSTKIDICLMHQSLHKLLYFYNYVSSITDFVLRYWKMSCLVNTIVQGRNGYYMKFMLKYILINSLSLLIHVSFHNILSLNQDINSSARQVCFMKNESVGSKDNA